MKNKNLVISLVIGGVILVLVIGVGMTGAFASLFSAGTGTSSGSTSTTTVADTSFITSSSTNSISTYIPSYSTTSSSSSSPSTSSTRTGYKDGTYTADGPYYSPGGQEDLSVTLTVRGGNVSNVNVTGNSNNRTSDRYIQIFASEVSGLVVGKPISQAYVDGYVSGASLTAQGFNTAVDSILQQAKN